MNRLRKEIVIEKLKRLHQIISCMKCGDWHSENFSNTSCRHLLCGRCLSFSQSNQGVRCDVLLPGESKACIEYFTKENVVPEPKFNQYYKGAIEMLDFYDLTINDLNIQDAEKVKLTNNGDGNEVSETSKSFNINSNTEDSSDSDSENNHTSEIIREKEIASKHNMSVFEIADSQPPNAMQPACSKSLRFESKCESQKTKKQKKTVATGFNFFGAKPESSKPVKRKSIKYVSKLSTFEVEDDQTHPEKENNSTEKDAFLPSKATLSKRSLFDVSSTTNTDFENTVNAEDKAVASESVIRKLKKRDCKGETELHRESKRGNLEKVLQLLELGADPNTEDNASLRPLHEHKALENSEVCRALLEYGADPRKHGGEQKITPLHVAVQHNYTNVIPLLIQCGSDIHATAKGNNEEAFTPLSFASFHKNAEVVKLLESEYQKVQNEKPLDGAVLKDYVTTPLKKPKYNLAEIEAVKCATPIGKIVKDGITHVSTSALSVKSKSLCETFSKKFKIKINPNYDDSCDALIVSKKSEPNMYSRTIKVVTALMRNGVLVDDSWIQDSLDNGKLLSYEKYLVDSFCEHKGSVKRARQAHDQSKKLFSGLEVFVRSNLDTEYLMAASQLKEVLALGGAKVLPREPKPASLIDSNMTIGDDSRPEFIAEKSSISDMRIIVVAGTIIDGDENIKFKQIIPGLYHVTANWVLGCIVTFAIE